MHRSQNTELAGTVHSVGEIATDVKSWKHSQYVLNISAEDKCCEYKLLYRDQ